MNDKETRQTRDAGVTNPAIARRLGMSESGVHRIRNGSRYPSLDVMRRVAAEYKWPLEDQLKLIPGGGARNLDYAHEFDRRVLEAS